jgi:hypothetical protein
MCAPAGRRAKHGCVPLILAGKGRAANDQNEQGNPKFEVRNSKGWKKRQNFQTKSGRGDGERKLVRPRLCAIPAPPPWGGTSPVEAGGMLAANLHRCTDAKTRPKTCHFLPLFRIGDWSCNQVTAFQMSNRDQGIGPGLCGFRRSKKKVAKTSGKMAVPSFDVVHYV